MKILAPHHIRAADAYTMAHEPVTSVDLMERAATACVQWIAERFDARRNIVVFAGPGNNGGDGLAIARLLQRMHRRVSVYLLTDSSRLSPDASINYQRLTECAPVVLTGENFSPVPASAVVVDALFGVGLSRPLEGLAADTVKHINDSAATVVAVDMPSGLFCEDNGGNNRDAIVRAHYTLTFQQPKLSFFFAENAPFTGEWTVMDIGLLPEGIEKQPSELYALQKSAIAGWVTPRGKFAHKGNFGHACILAGSHGMMGACVLAVRACLRTGAGLVTAHVPRGEGTIVQVTAPEAIVQADAGEALSQIPDMGAYSAVAIGPGIGRKAETQQALWTLLHQLRERETEHPPRLVLDADALNILAENKAWMQLLPEGSILTPHPGEFDRLAGASGNGYQRFLKQREMARRYAIYIVLKGAHTSVAAPDASCFFNTTGNPGMATAGSGDVLTGIIVSLLAQGWPPCRAACAGVWLHGRAGDLAARKMGEQALIASDVIHHIGDVFKELQAAE